MNKEKKTKPPSSQSQKERFIETAKKLETDESGAEFERAFSKIVPEKRVPLIGKAHKDK